MNKFILGVLGISLAMMMDAAVADEPDALSLDCRLCSYSAAWNCEMSSDNEDERRRFETVCFSGLYYCQAYCKGCDEKWVRREGEQCDPSGPLPSMYDPDRARRHILKCNDERTACCRRTDPLLERNNEYWDYEIRDYVQDKHWCDNPSVECKGQHQACVAAAYQWLTRPD